MTRTNPLTIKDDLARLWKDIWLECGMGLLGIFKDDELLFSASETRGIDLILIQAAASVLSDKTDRTIRDNKGRVRFRLYYTQGTSVAVSDEFAKRTFELDPAKPLREEAREHHRAAPHGRGMWLWRLPKCEGGDLSKIIDKAHACRIRWLVVKAGDQGRPWSQFKGSVVQRLQDAGIECYGWSYDVPTRWIDRTKGLQERPGILQRQAEVIKRVYELGAKGFVIDAEIEWTKAEDPDLEARDYIHTIRQGFGIPTSFVLGDAPPDYIRAHPRFPMTEFAGVNAKTSQPRESLGVVFRTPQTYWTAHHISVERTVTRLLNSYETYHQQRPAAVRPLLPSGSLFIDKGWPHPPTERDLRFFESEMEQAGFPGVCYWEWSQVPQDLWDALAKDPGGPI